MTASSSSSMHIVFLDLSPCSDPLSINSVGIHTYTILFLGSVCLYLNSSFVMYSALGDYYSLIHDLINCGFFVTRTSHNVLVIRGNVHTQNRG